MKALSWADLIVRDEDGQAPGKLSRYNPNDIADDSELEHSSCDCLIHSKSAKRWIEPGYMLFYATREELKG
jgi:hypothetical protein